MFVDGLNLTVRSVRLSRQTAQSTKWVLTGVVMFVNPACTVSLDTCYANLPERAPVRNHNRIRSRVITSLRRYNIVARPLRIGSFDVASLLLSNWTRRSWILLTRTFTVPKNHVSLLIALIYSPFVRGIFSSNLIKPNQTTFGSVRPKHSLEVCCKYFGLVNFGNFFFFFFCR